MKTSLLTYRNPVFFFSFFFGLPPVGLIDRTGDKPHACELCNKRFALACNLRAHMKTHEGTSNVTSNFLVFQSTSPFHPFNLRAKQKSFNESSITPLNHCQFERKHWNSLGLKKTQTRQRITLQKHLSWKKRTRSIWRWPRNQLPFTWSFYPTTSYLATSFLPLFADAQLFLALCNYVGAAALSHDLENVPNCFVFCLSSRKRRIFVACLDYPLLHSCV